MKLYDSKRAPNPRRVRWFMAEKGIEDIEIVEVDIFGGDHRQPGYLSMAGLPNVPALELDDGTGITESIAICRYLESLYPEPNLFGTDPRETAIIEMWTRRAEMMVATPLMLTVRHGHPALAALEKQVPEIATTQRATAERGLKVLDRRLGESAFIAADRVTMADIIAFTAIDFARMVKFAPADDLAHLGRWIDAMRARPAATAGT
ncbi:glutathione S-transferase family protein [Sphingomonas oligophenolica]|uniref:Glutathione S-transferase n=1 Tax=Sphingomonas oligophenolica TaxID=301154 RepID=A0A502CDY6_9SPHN|nr:glutathione S-transferase [Sphingomonas oligophenolica]TPG09941.1 glutathione S-transferase [Sphingomonas oligophenolica]